MSADLIAFLKAWYDWATSGAPDGEPLWRRYGLCHHVPYGVRDELKAALRASFGGSAYPFGHENYWPRWDNETQHECPKRLAWVRARLVEAGEIA